jgi:hypothetical protein
MGGGPCCSRITSNESDGEQRREVQCTYLTARLRREFSPSSERNPFSVRSPGHTGPNQYTRSAGQGNRNDGVNADQDR